MFVTVLTETYIDWKRIYQGLPVIKYIIIWNLQVLSYMFLSWTFFPWEHQAVSVFPYTDGWCLYQDPPMLQIDVGDPVAWGSRAPH